MKILLMGPQGSGKSTQAALLAEFLGLPKISTGDIFREAVQRNTGLGKKAKAFMGKGALVPDEIVIGIVDERLQKKDCRNGFILDGFPRTIKQAEALGRITGIDAVLNLKSEDNVIIKRVSSRRVCEKCQSGFNITSLKPKKSGICDKCSGRLIQREDDKPETVKKRLEVYRRETTPLMQYYEEKKLLKNINAEKSIEEVFEDAVKAMSSS